MSENQDTVDMDKLGQAAYTGQNAVVVDALTKNKQLAHLADTVGIRSVSAVSRRFSRVKSLIQP